MSTEHYDVAVVGYGPVGATAALMLGREGLRVLVLERDEDVYARARAVSTDEEVMRVWQRCGLADELARDMLPDRPVDLVDARGEPFLSLRPKGRGNGHPTQLFLHQPALERVLRAAVGRHPDVHVLLGHELTALVQREDHVQLTYGGQRCTASYVLAADGGSSPVRAMLGVGFDGTTHEDRWVVIDAQVLRDWPGQDRLRFHGDPARPAVDCPTPLGHHRWEFPVLPGEDEAELTSDEGVWRLLAGHGIGPHDVRLLRAVVYAHHVRVAARWRAGRVLLAGDAAHVMPPWIGQGMAAGVRDVGNLCWKLAAVVRGELAESVLDTYEQERRPHLRAVSRMSVLFGRVISERRRAVVAVRDPLCRAVMRAPRLGAWVREADWFPPARYAAGLRVGGGRRSAVGWLVPQPHVTGARGDRVLLDDALAPGWAVLALRPDPGTASWAAAGVPVVEVLPAGSAPRAGAVVDSGGVLEAWLRGRSTHAVAVRPDGVVYAAATASSPLAACPVRAATRR